MSQEKNRPDFFLMSVSLILVGLGLVTVYSSSAIYALEKYGNPAYFLVRQGLWISIGLVFALFFLVYDHQKLRAWVQPALVVCIAALVMVLVFGREVGGARRWLRWGGVGFQPSELAKLVLVLFVADYCDRKRSKLQDFKRGLLPLLAVIGVVCGLIFVQPDLGTPLLIVSVCLTMFLIGGASWKHLGAMGGVVALLGSAAIVLEPYRMRRLLSFLNPWEDAQGVSYQLVQSLLAIGSGGILGAGLGESRSKLLYLPEPHTDFVFPIFAEEFGLIGTWALLILFGLLTYAGFRVASRANQLFGSLLASGITLLISYQAVFNIAVVTGCLPTKGLPLPFLSFGGSSLVVTMSCIGILLNISRSAKPGPSIMEWKKDILEKPWLRS